MQNPTDAASRRYSRHAASCTTCAACGPVTAGTTRRCAGVRLREYTVTPKTKARYEAAVGQLVPFLEAQPSLKDLDSIVAEWLSYSGLVAFR